MLALPCSKSKSKDQNTKRRSQSFKSFEILLVRGVQVVPPSKACCSCDQPCSALYYNIQESNHCGSVKNETAVDNPTGGGRGCGFRNGNV